MSADHNHPDRETVLANVLVAGLYILSGCLVALLARFHEGSFLVYLPLGVALGLHLAHGSRILPGVFAGSFVLTFLIWFVLHSQPLSPAPPEGLVPVALAIATGAVLQTWTGGVILRHWVVDRINPFNHIRDLMVFLFGAGLLNSLIHSGFTQVSLAWSGLTSWSGLPGAWLSGWFGDTLGVWIATPFFFVFRKDAMGKLSPRKKLEAILLAVLFYLGSKAIFQNWGARWEYPMLFLLFPLLVWTAFRFRQQGAVVAVAMLTLMATWGTGRSSLLAGGELGEGLLLAQVYLLGLVFTTCLLTGLLSQSTRAVRRATQLGSLLNQSFHEIYIIDPRTFKFLFANLGARQALGYTLGELRHMTPADINPEFDVERVGRLFDSIRNGGNPRPVFESVHRRKDGTLYPVEVTLQLLRIDGVECIVAVDKDISEKKQFQRELIAAREKAEEANRAKSLFISSMSHEIRTPMNAILGYTQILEHDPQLIPNQRRKLEGIQKAGRHLLNLINDILDFSKIEAGKMELHPQDFSLSGMINDLFSIFRVRCDGKGLQLEVDCQFCAGNQWVNGDEGKLRQVLVNLLDNALKYTDEGKIVFRITGKGNDVYHFEVQDTGIGISPEKQKSIFQCFEQDLGGLERGGTGLGLAIAEKLVQMMGGTLKVESELGRGSRFYFNIPLSPAVESAHRKNGDYRKVIHLAPGSRVRALVVDDNEDNIEVLYEMLDDIGVEVIKACSGQEAIEKAGQCEPDIIFMDYKMPGLNGLEAAKAIQHENLHSKIVMVTALSFLQQRQKFAQEGIDGFIGKPFLREEILKVLKTVLHVEFEYASQDAVEARDENPFDPADDFSGVKIPNFLLLSLKKMAKLGMIAEVEKQLAEIEKINPEGRRLAAHLRALAQNFDKDGILKVLDKVEHARKSH